jgi:hypothetical protein
LNDVTDRGTGSWAICTAVATEFDRPLAVLANKEGEQTYESGIAS